MQQSRKTVRLYFGSLDGVTDDGGHILNKLDICFFAPYFLLLADLRAESKPQVWFFSIVSSRSDGVFNGIDRQGGGPGH